MYYSDLLWSCRAVWKNRGPFLTLILSWYVWYFWYRQLCSGHFLLPVCGDWVCGDPHGTCQTYMVLGDSWYVPKSAWWLLMPWCQIGTRPLASAMQYMESHTGHVNHVILGDSWYMCLSLHGSYWCPGSKLVPGHQQPQSSMWIATQHQGSFWECAQPIYCNVVSLAGRIQKMIPAINITMGDSMMCWRLLDVCLRQHGGCWWVGAKDRSTNVQPVCVELHRTWQPYVMSGDFWYLP